MNAGGHARSATGWPDAALRTDGELVMRHATSAIPGSSSMLVPATEWARAVSKRFTGIR